MLDGGWPLLHQAHGRPGAQVVKVEPPVSGDAARQRGPFLQGIPHPERSGLFFYLNTNKLGVTLNLADPAGKKLFLELIGQVHIMVEDSLPITGVA